MCSARVFAAGLETLYAKDRLFADADLHPNVMIEAYHPDVRPDPDSSQVERTMALQLQKGAGGEIELGYIEEIVPYQDGLVRIGLILDREYRLRKAVVLAATADLVDAFQGVTKNGLITRYTATSVRQLKYLYKIQKDKAPAVAFLAREVWVLGEEAKALIENE
ncbi:MAG: hypothetical protein GC138_08505 [Gammaproteobacteria bacterium]|nr:hypothetical protein [Gammaproteobacteria bacterium]